MSDETTTPETTPAPVAPVALVVETQTPAPVPVAETKVEPVEAKAPDLATELEAVRKRTAELEAALAAEKGETRALAFASAFERAGVAPQYRDFLRDQLGDVDPRSDAGLAAIDAMAKKHPAMLVAHVSTADPMAEYLRAKADEARKSGNTSMWGLIPPDMLRSASDVGGGVR